MSDTLASTDRIETRDDLGDDDAALWAYYMGQDRIAGKEAEKWAKRGRAVVKRYRDERETQTGRGAHRLNVLWSNVQTLMPTLYARTPKPDVQRRFLDPDDTGRLASMLLERALSYSLENTAFDAVMEGVVQDRLLPGRGTARVMYVPHFGDELPRESVEDEGETVDGAGDEEPLREVVYEEALITYVFWEDYREGSARTWREVPWLRYRAYMTRDEMVKRFGKATARKVNLNFTPKGAENGQDKDQPADIFKKAEIFEFWDKTCGRVVWLSPGTPDLILDKQDDPLRLPDFFPSPDPLLATTTTGNRIPVPDYAEYQDQASELDNLTARIDILTTALKVAGVYPGSNKAVLQQLIAPGTENLLIPVEDWPGWMDKGGLGQFIQFMPLKEIAETLVQLYAAREKTKELLYEITGIGDIMRGNTNPTETAAAQKLKSVFSTRRIQPQQRSVARFARDEIRLMAAVIAEHFSPQTISAITGYPQLQPVPPLPPQPPQVIPGPQQQPGAGPPSPQPGMPPGSPPGPAPGMGASPTPTGMMAPGQGPGMAPPAMVPNPAFVQWAALAGQVQAITQANQVKQQQFDAACALIKKDGVRGFKLDIEADSTIAPDEEAEKDSRVGFVREIVPLLQQTIPFAMGNPPLADLVSEIALFAIRAYRVARPLEEAFEKAFAAIGKMPAPPPKGATAGATKQDPALEQAKIAADVHDTQTRAAADTHAVDAKTQIAVMTLAQKNQQAQIEAQTASERAMAEDQHNQAQMALEAAKLHSQNMIAGARAMAAESKAAGRLD